MAIQEGVAGTAVRAPHDRAAWRGHGPATQLWVLTGRQVRAMYGDRRLALFGLLQPLIMLLLLSQVFGSMTRPSQLPHGVPYIDYLMPALLVTTGISSAQLAGIGLVKDMHNGIVARFRTLPVRLPLVLAARSLADLLRIFTELVVLLVFATAVLGFRPDGGAAGAVAALLLSTFVIWGLIWVFIALAAWLRKVEVMSSISVFFMFPLMFASSAFVPLDNLPTWLRAVAQVNPVTHAVSGARRLALGWELGFAVPGALGAGAVVLAVAGFVAVRCFSRPPHE
ncbi:ABC transporter permease [Streptomyces sp. NPDC046261]|uniref:ABC transporter permease n=1 Tax=Streptomyces sp. NPDC046261 TaxID=3157200 RepID=UPI0033D569C9